MQGISRKMEATGRSPLEYWKNQTSDRTAQCADDSETVCEWRRSKLSPHWSSQLSYRSEWAPKTSHTNLQLWHLIPNLRCESTSLSWHEDQKRKQIAWWRFCHWDNRVWCIQKTQSCWWNWILIKRNPRFLVRVQRDNMSQRRNSRHHPSSLASSCSNNTIDILWKLNRSDCYGRTQIPQTHHSMATTLNGFWHKQSNSWTSNGDTKHYPGLWHKHGWTLCCGNNTSQWFQQLPFRCEGRNTPMSLIFWRKGRKWMCIRGLNCWNRRNGTMLLTPGRSNGKIGIYLLKAQCFH